MKKGFLSEYFRSVASKRLSTVEIEPNASNQHEFNGVAGLKKILGTEKQYIKATFFYFEDDMEENIREEGDLTWYDSRKNHPKRSEFRLYFQETEVSRLAAPNDLFIMAIKNDGKAFIIIARQNSTAEHQLAWLFNLPEHSGKSFAVQEESDNDSIKTGIFSQHLLEQLGIVLPSTEESCLEEMLCKFNGKFPSTLEFSAFAREKVGDFDAYDNRADDVLSTWMQKEENLFRTLERHLVGKRIDEGFSGDTRVDTFISFSLSVQNRRKSRAGNALENHLSFLFERLNIKFSRTPQTEGHSKPDFLFPGIEEYQNPLFPARSLTMLGVKTTCKDRWRQILAEADRIEEKHLFTLQSGISQNQTDEMGAHKVQLVIPRQIHSSFSVGQQCQLMTLDDFVGLVRERQNH
ncbi:MULTISPECIES: type II restriction endonuclease [Desulfovibrio]|uniref:type II restriction endonuclease n=1 Tax=Desulfovibrio TaxID=872 RepID=UPI001959DC09|nr:type II restriction endonuclease [Desulfovibrio piger]MBM6894467.1 restriction endonuclease [Desulfovibrio piger]